MVVSSAVSEPIVPAPKAAVQMHGAAIALAALARLQPGSVLAERFEVVALADWGGMGAVYRATDRQSGQDVALKVILEGGTDERFARESKLLAELQHPRIVRYVAHGRTESGLPYLVMEWLEGKSLRHVLGARRLGIRESVTMVRGVSEALSLAHDRGVVHRDINPRNIFLPGERVDAPKVLDFGIARPSHATWALTLPGSQLGTPGYMAPEQARGEAEIDGRVDVFALGCVLFECLAGRPAFVGDNMMALLSKVLLEEPPRLGTLRPVPPLLEDLVARMLAKHAVRRPADGAAMLIELDRVATELAGVVDDESPEPPDSAPPTSLGNLEQRLVCVVMAGPSPDRALVSEAATLASEGGPEMVTRSRLLRFGAKTEWLADGSVVATLTSDGDATDHATQAARFALALRDAVKTGPIALATGRGVVTGGTPVGEVLERAAHLLSETTAASRELQTSQDAPPIRIDHVTAGLLDLRFDVTDDPIGRELRGTRDGGDTARTVLGRSTTCVGRDRDLATLEATFSECAEESVARAVLVTGPAGMGKSRLRRELLRRLRRRGESMEVFFGRADPMSAGAPFAMIAMAVRGAAGVGEGEPLAVRRQKISVRVGRRVADADRSRVSEFLGELVGAPFPDDQSIQLQAARRDPTLRGDQMRRAWEDWIRAECQKGPVLLILEDLHWGDIPTVKVIDATLRNLHDQPLMVLALARPDVHELFPNVWQQRGVTELRLAPLTRKAGEKLVREVLGDDVAEAVIGRIVERAAGNPFCIEELIRAEADGRGDDVPATVLAIAQARLERLSQGGRRVLRAAAVFGEASWRGGLVALLGGDGSARDVDEWLRYLIDREILASRGLRKFPGEDEYAFQHPTMREAAYAMLTPDDRVLGHKLAAAWLEAAGEADALTLAQHYELGAAGDGAVRWYRRAAEQALEGGDLEAVLQRAARAIAQGARGEALGHVRLLEAEAHKWRGENERAEAAAREALALLPQATAPWCAAVGEVAAACGKLGRRELLLDIATVLLELTAAGDRDPRIIATARTATQLVLTGRSDVALQLLALIQSLSAGGVHDHPGVAAWVLEAKAVSAAGGEDPSARLKYAEAAADCFEQAGDMRNACLQRASVGHAYNELGAYPRALRALRDALVISERMGLDNVVGIIQAQLGRAITRTSSHLEGRDMMSKAIATLAAQKNTRLEGVARSWLANIDLERGELESAEREALLGEELLSKAPALRCRAIASIAGVRLAQGRIDEAIVLAREGTAVADSVGKAAIGDTHLRVVLAEALHRKGDHDGARTSIESARARLVQRSEKIADAGLRRSFLGRPENARTLELADTWLDPTA